MSLCSVCGSCASRKFMLLPSTRSVKSPTQILSLSSYSRASTRRRHEKNDKQLVLERDGVTACCGSNKRRPFLMMSALTISAPPPVADNLVGYIIRRCFHYRPLIQLCIQHSNNLFEALQKRHAVPSVVSRTSEEEQPPQYFFNIPDELRRLKPGSLKWLFEVWPGGSGVKKNYSALTTIKSVLEKEVDSDQDVKQVMSKTQNILRTANEQQLYDVLDYLKSRNIAIRRLIKLPWLLTANPQALEASVKRAQKVLDLKEFKVAISFVNINHTKLQEVALLWRKEQFMERKQGNQLFENRVEWMASKLQCPSEDVSDMMAKYPRVMSIPLQQIRGVLEVLLTEYQVKADAIIRDPWTFNITIKAIQKRGHHLKECGYPLMLVKPWLFRCPQRNFDQHVDRQLEQMQLLGAHKDIKGFLREKLNCPKEGDIVGEMLLKVPSIQTATVIKLNEMIEFLFSVGYTAQQIRETPRILAHSVETISERLKEVTAFTQPLDNLQVLCRTSKDYRAILRKLKREDAARKKGKNSVKMTTSITSSV